MIQQTLTSLPKREVLSGFAEVLKHGFIWDATFVELAYRPIGIICLALEEPYLSEALYRGCPIKARWLPGMSEKKVYELFLNFGHTFGHAFEALGEYQPVYPWRGHFHWNGFGGRIEFDQYDNPEISEGQLSR